MSRGPAGIATRSSNGHPIPPAGPSEFPRRRRERGPLMSDELIGLTASQAADRIRAGDLTGEEYFHAYREAAAGDSLNAFLWTADEAGASGDGPLAGIPIAVKDIFCTEGVPTTAGSRILEGYRPPYPATAVRRLRDAGAGVLGKANMDEVPMGSRHANTL